MEDYLIIVAKSNNTNFTVCKPGQKEESIKRAHEFYKDEIALLEKNLIECPQMADEWNRGIRRAEETLSQGFEAVTHDEYYEREKKRIVTGEIHEITAEQYDYALNVLPPLNWVHNEKCSYFFMSERWTLSFTNQYYHDKETGKYYEKMVDLYDKSTWIGANL